MKNELDSKLFTIEKDASLDDYKLNQKNIYVGDNAHNSWVIENHIGTLRLTGEGKIDDEMLQREYYAKLQVAKNEGHAIGSDKKIKPENLSNSIILAAPKVNECNVFLIKNKTNGDLFIFHRNQYDSGKKNVYDYLFESLNTMDEIDIVVAAGYLQKEYFEEKFKEKNINVSSCRALNSKSFFSPSVFANGEPESLSVAYDPADDRMIIFGDESIMDKKKACYIGEGIFSEPNKQIIMRRVKNISDFPSGLEKESNWDSFSNCLPLMSNSFIKRCTGKEGASAINYYDESLDIAQQLFSHLNEDEKKKAHELGMNAIGASFIFNSVIGRLEGKVSDKILETLKIISPIKSKDINFEKNSHKPFTADRLDGKVNSNANTYIIG
jgi:hypothetical protein